jgi:hypothetical protein
MNLFNNQILVYLIPRQLVLGHFFPGYHDPPDFLQTPMFAHALTRWPSSAFGKLWQGTYRCGNCQDLQFKF